MQIQKSVTVACPPRRAFHAFTHQIGQWWPLHSGYSFGGEKAQDLFLEAREGGRIYERYSDGTMQLLGEVTACEPPRHIAFTWLPPGWDAATQVDVRFTATAEGTRLDLVHSGWEALGASGSEARDSYASGWDEVLQLYGGFAVRLQPVHGSLDWIELPAPDPMATANFYAELFDWEISVDDNWPNFPMFKDAAGVASGAFNRQWTPSEAPSIVPHITTDDIDATLKRIAAAGGDTVKPKTLIHESMGWYALFRDPAGNTLGLFEAASQNP